MSWVNTFGSLTKSCSITIGGHEYFTFTCPKGHVHKEQRDICGFQDYVYNKKYVHGFFRKPLEVFFQHHQKDFTLSSEKTITYKMQNGDEINITVKHRLSRKERKQIKLQNALQKIAAYLETYAEQTFQKPPEECDSTELFFELNNCLEGWMNIWERECTYDGYHESRCQDPFFKRYSSLENMSMFRVFQALVTKANAFTMEKCFIGTPCEETEFKKEKNHSGQVVDNMDGEYMDMWRLLTMN